MFRKFKRKHLWRGSYLELEVEVKAMGFSVNFLKILSKT